jgi:predicted ester cyclase
MCRPAYATTLGRTEPDNIGGVMGTGRQAVERLFAVVDGQRWDEYRDVMSADVEFTGPWGALHGADAWAEFSKGFSVAVPDGRHTIERFVESGSTVAIDGYWSGTNLGPFTGPQGEVPPTGQSVRVPFAAIAELRDGTVARVDVYLDQLSMFTQLGLMPAPANA